MEALWILVALIIPLVALATVVFAFVAFFRSRSLERRMVELAYAVADLQRRVAQDDRPGDRPAPVAETSVAAAPADEVVTTEVTPAARPIEPPAPSEPSPAPSEPPPRETVVAAPARPAWKEEAPAAEPIPEAAPTPAAEPAPPADLRDERAPAAAPVAASAPAPRRDWERWLGVRGAAMAGGVLLALAGLLLFQYTIEQGLISPPVRVALGVVAGLAAIAIGSRLRRRGYDTAGSALCGGGVVALYGAIWAAHVLYQLIANPLLALLLLAAVTAGCALLAARQRSLLIAVLGLAGGFAAPLVVPAAIDQPLGRFGYLLILDTGMLALALSRRWPVLALLSLVATAGHQALLLLFGNGAAQPVTALLILGVFALLFALVPARRTAAAEDDRSELHWRLAQAGGVLIPFLFALRLAEIAPSAGGPPGWSLAGLLLLLNAAAIWIWQRSGWQLVPIGAAASTLGVLAARLESIGGRSPEGAAIAWWAVLTGLAVALLLEHAPGWRWLRQSDGPNAGSSRPALIFQLGLFILLVFAALSEPAFTAWPWLTAWLALPAIWLARLTRGPAHGVTPTATSPPAATAADARPAHWQTWLYPTAGALTGGALTLFRLEHGAAPWMPPPLIYFGLALAAAALFQLAAAKAGKQDSELRRQRAAQGALLVPLPLALALSGASGSFTEAVVVAGAALLGGLLAALAAARIPSGAGVLLALAATALPLTAQTGFFLDPGEAPPFFLAALAGLLLFAAWPFVGDRLVGNRPWSSETQGARRLARQVWAWRAAALASILFLPALYIAAQSWLELSSGSTALAAIPVGAALPALIAAAIVLRRGGPPDSGDLPALRRCWLIEVPLLLTALALSLRFDGDPLWIALSLLALATAIVWRRLPFTGVMAVALLLGGLVTLRLLHFESVLDGRWVSSRPLVNQLALLYLLPAAAFLGCGWLFGRPPEARRGPAADGLRRIPAVAASFVAAAIVLVFVWLNLTIFDLYSSGELLSISFERHPARDLTLSIAWALYALALMAVALVLGRRAGASPFSAGLRWLRRASLGLFMLTLVKVFLYDLGELTDLYRVASLLGLAVSLILVSLAYQRFVSGEEHTPPTAVEEDHERTAELFAERTAEPSNDTSPRSPTGGQLPGPPDGTAG